MARHWLNDGKPLADGRLCLVIDPEDGTQPIRIWGRSKEEILDKATKTVEHGARTITTLRTQIGNPPSKPPTNTSGASATAAPAPRSTQLSVTEQMQLTADLSNPAKAPAAVTRLVEHHTGLNLDEMSKNETVQRIAAIQANWSYSHPDFPKHPINYKLMNDAAALRVGYENITAEVLDTVYNELLSAGMLVDEEEPPPTPTVPPEENPASRTVRPRGAASHRRTITSPAPIAASTEPKYTREQLTAMPSAEFRRKLESDPAFAAEANRVLGTLPA
jgi:hypothetical protein